MGTGAWAKARFDLGIGLGVGGRLKRRRTPLNCTKLKLNANITNALTGN